MDQTCPFRFLDLVDLGREAAAEGIGAIGVAPAWRGGGRKSAWNLLGAQGSFCYFVSLYSSHVFPRCSRGSAMSAAVLPSANGSVAKLHAKGKPRASGARGATRKGSGVNCDSRLPCGESKPQLTPDPLGATDPLGPTPEPGKKSRKRRAWQPEARDHYIYQLVKFEGHTQGEAAVMQRLSQATVSRIIDRYERWQAHADPREGGRLDPAERLRAQRWLTYERNELILGSALRIARAVEGTAELWKTVRTEPKDPYRTDKASVRDETTMIDRTGVAARFLRLAFKVNMEQLALVEKDPPPLPGPLNDEEVAEEERQDAAVAEEFRRQELLAGTKPGPGDAPESTENECPPLREQVCSRLEEEPGAAPLNLHNLHDGPGEKSGATANPPCTCAADARAEKNPADACIAEIDEVSPPRRRFQEVRSPLSLLGGGP